MKAVFNRVTDFVHAYPHGVQIRVALFACRHRARADFPGSEAHALYRSIHRLLVRSPETRIFVCHDYPLKGRDAKWETTVAEQGAGNLHVHAGISEEAFVTMCKARDATLEAPTLTLPSIQMNVRAGQLPLADENGIA